MIRILIGFVLAILLVEVFAPGLELMPFFEAIFGWFVSVLDALLTEVGSA